jgi:hypothetical protein
MSRSILSAIDAEISRLKQVRALLSSAGSAQVKRKPGRPAITAPVGVPIIQKRKKRGNLSAEGRERIRQAQIRRWAAVKQSAAPDANAGTGAQSKSRKKAAKRAA